MSVIHNPGELTLEELVVATESTKYLALATCVFLGCEIIATLPGEVKYVWRSRWNFGRVMFHANRVWGPIMLLGYVPTAFMYGLSNKVRTASYWTSIALTFAYNERPAWNFYIYASVIAQIIVATVLIARIWAIYEMRVWVLLAVIFGCLAVASPAVVITQLQAQESSLLENPAPTVISGCPVKLNSLTFVPYLPPFGSETILFVMTVYKPWKMSRTQMRTPLMTKLIQTGTQYYVIVLGALLFVVLGSLNKMTNHAVNGSGILTAVWSSMCTRLILSGRSWYDRMNSAPSASDDTTVEMNTLPTVWRQSISEGGSRAWEQKPPRVGDRVLEEGRR